jgi:hypothetical protein
VRFRLHPQPNACGQDTSQQNPFSAKDLDHMGTISQIAARRDSPFPALGGQTHADHGMVGEIVIE